MAELEQDIDFSSAIVGAQKPAPVKKKIQPQVANTTTSDLNSVSQPTKSFSGSQLKEDRGQLISGPNAAFGQLGNRLPSAKPLPEQELPSTEGEIFRTPPKPKPYNLRDKAWLEKNPVLWNSKKQIDEWDNVKKNLEGGTYEAIAAVDYGFGGPMAADWAEHIALTTFGLNDDYNKLSPEAKKIVKQTVRGQVGGTAMMGQTAMGMEKLANFWQNESKKVLDSAIKREGDSLTDMANFIEHPSTDTAKNLIFRGLETTARTIPYMVATAATGGETGLILAGGMAAGTEAQEEEQKTGNRGVGYLLSNAYTGIAEGFFEKYTQGILKKAGNLVKGDVKAAEELAKGFVKSVADDFGVEGASEAATTATQELASKWAKGEDVDPWDVARKVADSFILGGMSGAGISSIGQLGGRVSQKGRDVIDNYVATKIISTEDSEKIKNNTETIQSLRVQANSENITPEAKEVINSKIKQLASQNEEIKQANLNVAKNLSLKGVEVVFSIDDQLRKIQKEAKSIMDDTSLETDAKDLLLKDLLEKHNELKQKRNAIQEQATSEVPLLSEAGVSGEMAEGESQAKPQGTTEEGKGEEVVPNELQGLEEYFSNNTRSTQETRYNPDLSGEGEMALREQEDELLRLGADRVQAHGISKGSIGQQFKDLINILTNGLDNRGNGQLYTAPLVVPTEMRGGAGAALGTSGGTAYIDGGFIILAKPGVNEIRSVNDIGGVLVNESVAETLPELVERLKNSFPNLSIESYSNAPRAVESLFSQQKNKTTPTQEVSKPTEMSQEEWTKLQDLADRMFNGEEITNEDDLKLQEQYPDTLEKLLSKKAEPIAEMPEGLSEKAAATVDNVVNEIKEQQRIYPKRALAKHMESGLNSLQKSEAYAEADDVVREQMIREVNKAFGIKEKKAPSAEKILGQKKQKPTIIEVDELKAFKDQLNRESKAANAGVSFAQNAKKIITDYLKTKTGGALDPAEQNRLFKALEMDFTKPENRTKFISKVNEVFKRSENKIAIDRLDALHATLKAAAKGAKEGFKAGVKQTKEQLNRLAKDKKESLENVVKEVRGLLKNVKITNTQRDSIINGLKDNLSNETIRERYINKVKKIVTKANYLALVAKGEKFRTDIGKLSDGKSLLGPVRAMAKDFLRINPDLVDDIDKYNEIAQQVLDSVKNNRVSSKQLESLLAIEEEAGSQTKLTQSNKKTIEQYTVDSRIPALINYVSEYTKEQVKIQDEALKQTLLDEFQELVDNGVISEDMSLKDIQSLINDIKQGTPAQNIEKRQEKEKAARAFVKNSFKNLSLAARYMIDGFAPFAGQLVRVTDPITGVVKSSNTVRNIVNDFLSIDIDNVPNLEDAYAIIDALGNFVVNGNIDNMVALYEFQQGVKESIKIAKEGVIAQNYRKIAFGSNALSETWAINISPVKAFLDWTFRSREIGTKVFNAMGLRGLSNASSQANIESNKISDAYSDLFKDKMPNNQKFNTAENTYERGIYAHLRRTLIGDKSQVQKEFERRKGQITQSIDALKETGDDKLFKRAELIEKVFEKFKDATNIEQVEAKVDPINKDAVVWWNSIFDKYYPEVKRVSRSVYNSILEDDINYSPDIYEKILNVKESKLNDKRLYKPAFDFVNAEKSGSLMENQRLTKLPSDRVISFDFDYNNSSTFGKMLGDIRTAPYVQRYKGFTSSDAFKQIFPNVNDRNLALERLNYYVNEVRGTNNIEGSDRLRRIDSFLKKFSRRGTARALGSAASFVKQSTTALSNTLVNLALNPTAFTKGFATLFNPDAQKWFENTGYSTSGRGLDASTSIESANKAIEKLDLNRISQITDAVDSIGEKYLDLFLKNGDVLGARASWMAYYINKLDKMGINTSNIDWKNHKLVEEAANYAEDQVNLQQNVSDSAMLGKLLNSKSAGTSIARQSLLAFSSFIFNVKDRIYTDLTIVSSKNTTWNERAKAVASLAAAGVEMATFEALGSLISEIMTQTLNSIMGTDDDEEEKEARYKRYKEQAAARFVKDVLSPVPTGIVEVPVVAGANWLLQKIQSDKEEEEMFLLSDPNETRGEFIARLVGGVPGIAIKPAIQIAETMITLNDGYVTDKYGNQHELTNEQIDQFRFILAAEIINSRNILPGDFNTLTQKAKSKVTRDVIKNE